MGFSSTKVLHLPGCTVTHPRSDCILLEPSQLVEVEGVRGEGAEGPRAKETVWMTSDEVAPVGILMVDV